jgi:hypothetical protein
MRSAAIEIGREAMQPEARHNDELVMQGGNHRAHELAWQAADILQYSHFLILIGLARAFSTAVAVP